MQFPLSGLPRDLGLRGAVFADAGTCSATRARPTSRRAADPACPSDVAPALHPGHLRDGARLGRDPLVGRRHVLWASPLGPIRFDYAYALTKDKYDVTQAFRFSGGTHVLIAV